MTIAAELKDATPQEREEWMAFLSRVDDEQVPYMLQSRRMTMRQHAAAGQPVSSLTPERVVAESNLVPGQESALPEVAPAAGGSVEAAAMAAAAVAHPLADTENSGGPEVVSGEARSAAPPGISQRLKSLAEPTWSWMHINEPAVDSPEDGPARPDRGVFGIPQLLGAPPRSAAPAALGPEARAVAPPQVPPAGPVALTPGAHLWEDELRKVIALLEAEATPPRGADEAAQREAARRQVALRLLYLANDDPTLAQQSIALLPTAEQEFWTAMFVALADQRNAEFSAEERATRTAAQLRVAANRLQSSARLQLRNVTRCEEIIGFGNYRATSGDRVTPGQSVLVYAEIRNFHSDPTVDGFYRTAISSIVEIVGPEGRVIDRKSYPAEDLSRSLRNDYFHSYRIDLPASLDAGLHQLKITIRDDLANKTATEVIPFTVR